MRALVTGASGFVGKSLINILNQQDINVVGIGRQLAVSSADTFFSVPDFSASDVWKKPLEGCDVVVHLAARVHVMNDKAVDPIAEFRKVNVDSTMNLARSAANEGVKRFIFISTIGVNGNVTDAGQPFTSQDRPNPHDPYSISKYEAEQELIEHCSKLGMELVIIRPPLIYGFEAPGNFNKLINSLKKGWPLPLGAIHNKRSFVYVGNLVSLIMHCINHPAAANEVFLVSDGHDLSTTELLKQCAVALGVKSRLLPVPQKLIEIGAAMFGKRAVAQRLCGNLQVDITKARELLGWKPPYTVADGLKAAALGLIRGR